MISVTMSMSAFLHWFQLLFVIHKKTTVIFVSKLFKRM